MKVFGRSWLPDSTTPARTAAPRKYLTFSYVQASTTLVEDLQPRAGVMEDLSIIMHGTTPLDDDRSSCDVDRSKHQLRRCIGTQIKNRTTLLQALRPAFSASLGSSITTASRRLRP